MNFQNSRLKLLLIAILLLAGVFRLWGVTQADVITDEALIAFRSIEYVDFFASPNQSTPYEWFNVVPAWAKLSFHDHPPLVFIIQFIFFKLFGVSLLVLRLPFVLAGMASVYLTFLIGKKLFNENVGLLSGLLLAISSAHVWASRIGLQESIVIFLSLLTVYFFLKALEDNKHYKWGIVFGLAILTKYTAFALLPIFILYGLFFYRKIFNKNFWLALILSVLIFSPVLIYNFSLYQARGHFDLQFSYLLNQDVPEWEFLPGKIQAGSFSDRLANLAPSLLQTLMWPVLILFIFGFVYLIYKFTKQKNPKLGFLIIALVVYLASLLLTGPASRFIITMVPFTTLVISWFLLSQKKIIFYTLISLLVVLEIFISANTLLAHYPVGQVGITYSKLKFDSYSWGYNELNDYVESLVKDSKPALTFETKYQFLEDLKGEALDKDAPEGPILLIYDANMHDLAALWIFHRQLVYSAWPVVTADVFNEQSLDFWRASGIENFYFFHIIDSEILQLSKNERTSGALELSKKLNEAEIEIIKRPDGREVFAVYNFN